jgi:hypothetical protein
MRPVSLIARAATVVIIVAAAACADSSEQGPAPEAAEEVGEAEQLPRQPPPPSETAPRYVGLWAAAAEGCSDPAWRFEEDRVTTRGEVSCEFRSVTPTDRGYDIQASCTAEAPPAPYEIQLSFAESARAMMIAGGPWQSGTALVFCSALPPP